VRTHVLLWMIAYYLEWRMRQTLRPIIFDDPDRAAAEVARKSIVTKAQRSPAAMRKVAARRTEDACRSTASSRC
jgi:hypothetical protein